MPVPPQATKRNEAIHFGAGDFAASIGAKVTSIGGVNDNYGVLQNKKGNIRNYFINDMWHYALFKIFFFDKKSQGTSSSRNLVCIENTIKLLQILYQIITVVKR